MKFKTQKQKVSHRKNISDSGSGLERRKIGSPFRNNVVLAITILSSAWKRLWVHKN